MLATCSWGIWSFGPAKGQCSRGSSCSERGALIGWGGEGEAGDGRFGCQGPQGGCVHLLPEVKGDAGRERRRAGAFLTRIFCRGFTEGEQSHWGRGGWWRGSRRRGSGGVSLLRLLGAGAVLPLDAGQVALVVSEDGVEVAQRVVVHMLADPVAHRLVERRQLPAVLPAAAAGGGARAGGGAIGLLGHDVSAGLGWGGPIERHTWEERERKRGEWSRSRKREREGANKPRPLLITLHHRAAEKPGPHEGAFTAGVCVFPKYAGLNVCVSGSDSWSIFSNQPVE